MCENGHPTPDALQAITEWYVGDPKGWFQYIENLWALRYSSWSVCIEYNKLKLRNVIRIYAWEHDFQGNSDLIFAMRNNKVMWSQHWVQSKRGGHHIFEREL